jgi:hypothetical protein
MTLTEEEIHRILHESRTRKRDDIRVFQKGEETPHSVEQALRRLTIYFQQSSEPGRIVSPLPVTTSWFGGFPVSLNANDDFLMSLSEGQHWVGYGTTVIEWSSDADPPETTLDKIRTISPNKDHIRRMRELLLTPGRIPPKEVEDELNKTAFLIQRVYPGDPFKISPEESKRLKRISDFVRKHKLGDDILVTKSDYEKRYHEKGKLYWKADLLSKFLYSARLSRIVQTEERRKKPSAKTSVDLWAKSATLSSEYSLVFPEDSDLPKRLTHSISTQPSRTSHGPARTGEGAGGRK